MTHKVNLALQGGGAHGAFTWGVLDFLLEDGSVEIAAISGASAGALNGAVLKAGLVHGGAAQARADLRKLWHAIAGQELGKMPQWWQDWLPDTATLARATEYAPGYIWGDLANRLSSPYGQGPLYQNPLTSLVEALDFEAIRSAQGPELFVGATNLRSGKVKIFEKSQLCPKAILASACLPSLFRAIEIEDPKTGKIEAYWDGGFTGNPALFPLFSPELPDDIIVININPLYRHDLPMTAAEIQNRINEISFNSSLLRELRAIAFVKRLIAEGTLAQGQMKDVLVHFIADDDLMRQLSVATKIVPNPIILERLFNAGRRAAARFLDNHKQDLGARGSVDLVDMFQ